MCGPLVVRWLELPATVHSADLTARGLSALGRLANDNARQYVRQQASRDASASQRAAALAALNIFDSPAAAVGTLSMLRSLQPSDLAAGEAAASALVSRATGVDALRKALEDNQPAEWSADGARILIAAVRNAAGSDEALLNKVLSATRFDALGWKWSDAWAKDIIEQAMNKGDAARGESSIAMRACNVCGGHAIGIGGGVIGPTWSAWVVVRRPSTFFNR